MNELQVTVNQTPGVIEWNFEELKEELAAQMQMYTHIVYTDENIKNAKADVASLRKLSKAVNARKIEIKNKCLEPYAVIESQAKELMALIDKPIAMIDSKVKEYQERQRQIRKDQIIGCMKEMFAPLPEEVATKLRFKVYDTRWENATTSQKTFKEAIAIAYEKTKNELGLLKEIDADFYDEVYGVYLKELDFTEAIKRSTYLQKKREEILERERQRQLMEAKRAEEEKIRQEREQALILAQEELKRRGSEIIDMLHPVEAHAASEPADALMEKAVAPEVVVKNANVVRYPSIVFKGTPEQFDKVIGYMKWMNADFEVIL